MYDEQQIKKVERPLSGVEHEHKGKMSICFETTLIFENLTFLFILKKYVCGQYFITKLQKLKMYLSIFNFLKK